MIFKISFLYCIQGCPADILIVHRLTLPLVFFSLKEQKFGFWCSSMIKLWSAYMVSRVSSLALQHEQIKIYIYLGKKCTEIKKQPNKAVPWLQGQYQVNETNLKGLQCALALENSEERCPETLLLWFGIIGFFPLVYPFYSSACNFV